MFSFLKISFQRHLRNKKCMCVLGRGGWKRREMEHQDRIYPKLFILFLLSAKSFFVLLLEMLLDGKAMQANSPANANHFVSTKTKNSLGLFHIKAKTCLPLITRALAKYSSPTRQTFCQSLLNQQKLNQEKDCIPFKENHQYVSLGSSDFKMQNFHL